SPHNVYKALDGWVVIVIGEDNKWENFLRKIRASEYIDASRLKLLSDRTANAEIVDKIVSEWSLKHTMDYDTNIVKECGGAAASIRKLDELITDQQVIARNRLVNTVHPVIGNFITIGPALKMSETPGIIKFPGMPLGYNNEEIYKDLLHLSVKEISTLKNNGII
ncbi:MAG: CoA transferase, partial [Candidatus Micrarchaeaceae archaeon]